MTPSQTNARAGVMGWRVRAGLRVALCSTVLLTGCARETAAPIDSAAVYLVPGETRYWMVAPGDTLYSIAWATGLDYRTLARWNHMTSPYRLQAGTRVRLYGPAPQGRQAKGYQRQRRYARLRAAPLERAPIRWVWPAHGQVITVFRPALGHKGIDIAAAAGTPVRAAAAGRVVYAGSGLRGYGELIIIKNNNKFLSAYAHNSRILVEEGDSVRQGQKIAEMGSSGTDRVMLHFEIRLRGNPVNPLTYLPRTQ